MSQTGPHDSQAGPHDSQAGPHDSQAGPHDSQTGPHDSQTVHLDGLRITSPLELPLPDAAGGGACDWTISFGDAPFLPPEGAVAWTGEASDGDVRWARFGRVGKQRLVRLEGVLDLLAEPARGTATIHPAAAVALPTYLLRRAMPYLVQLTGAVALHAACVVRPDGGAWLLSGDSGTGKSTLALALDGEGIPVLADDHVAVRPGAGDSLVAAASLPFVDAAPGAVARFRPDLGVVPQKRSVALRTPRPEDAPVQGIAFLSRGSGGAPRALAGPEVARRMLADVIFVADPESPEEQARRLEVAARFAEGAVAVDLPVPEGLEALDARQILAGVFELESE